MEVEKIRKIEVITPFLENRKMKIFSIFFSKSFAGLAGFPANLTGGMCFKQEFSGPAGFPPGPAGNFLEIVNSSNCTRFAKNHDFFFPIYRKCAKTHTKHNKTRHKNCRVRNMAMTETPSTIYGNKKMTYISFFSPQME